MSGHSFPEADLFAVILGQRACRAFASDAVPDSDVELILEAAVHAPSADNLQPWVFIVVRDSVVRREIDEMYRGVWDGWGREFASRMGAPALIREVDEATAVGFGGAPLLIVVCGEAVDPLLRSHLGSSIFPAVQNLLLATAGLGYGAAFTGLVAFLADPLRELLCLPDAVEPIAAIPVGRPAKPLGRPRRLPVSSKAHLNRYGSPLFST